MKPGRSRLPDTARNPLFPAIVALAALALALFSPHCAHCDSVVSIYPGGKSAFVVRGDLADSVAEMDITIEYDVTVMAKPSVGSGSLVSQAQFEADTVTAGYVDLHIKSKQPLRGSGLLASITFTSLDGSPGRINAMNVRAADPNGEGVTVQAKVVNPDANDTGGGGRPKPPIKAKPGAAPAPVDDASTAQAPDGSPVAGATAGDGTGKGPGLSRPDRIESILDRFRRYGGERTESALAMLFKAPIAPGYRQEPPVVLSDGDATARVTLKLAGEGKEAPVFILEKAHLVSLGGGGEGEGWIIEVAPFPGAYEASLTVRSGATLTRYPLTVAPPCPGPGDAAVKRACNETVAPLPGYLADYIAAANRLAAKLQREAGGKAP